MTVESNNRKPITTVAKNKPDIISGVSSVPMIKNSRHMSSAPIGTQLSSAEWALRVSVGIKRI
ncbi:hypothetical protein RCO12_06700 [Staphylococcus coagulans]|uniref:Uncharacterized protein n=1 Tax=Staphylococcus coagulans TaxID=74706 RepID=A0ABU1EYC5_9STAP|nr:hypothetical protein [Staphylococcus coagulans]MDR5603125.1 hypothetical protein [Staphylococcus coagulans]